MHRPPRETARASPSKSIARPIKSPREHAGKRRDFPRARRLIAAGFSYLAYNDLISYVHARRYIRSAARTHARTYIHRYVVASRARAFPLEQVCVHVRECTCGGAMHADTRVHGPGRWTTVIHNGGRVVVLCTRGAGMATGSINTPARHRLPISSSTLPCPTS